MDHSVFRQKSMERITSPEQMNDYIRVSNPSVWMLLAAVIVLLIGVCVWGAFGHLDTVVQTGGVCEDGRLTVYLSESDFIKLDGEVILSVGEAEYAVVSDAAGAPPPPPGRPRPDMRTAPTTRGGGRADPAR